MKGSRKVGVGGDRAKESLLGNYKRKSALEEKVLVGEHETHEGGSLDRRKSVQARRKDSRWDPVKGTIDASNSGQPLLVVRRVLARIIYDFFLEGRLQAGSRGSTR